MIQRIQSIWMLLAAGCTACLYYFPVYMIALQGGERRFLMVGERYHLLIIAAAMLLLPLVSIFLFKHRTRQKKLIWLAVLLNVLFTVLFWLATSAFAKDLPVAKQTFQLGALLPLLNIAFLLMAYSGIRKDEKLIKSVDRLR